MADIILLIISIVIGSALLVVACLGYIIDTLANNPKTVSNLSLKILILTIVIIALNTIVAPLVDFIYKEPHDRDGSDHAKFVKF
jgi:hypothetical protein